MVGPLNNFFILEIRQLRLQVESQATEIAFYKKELEKQKSEVQQQKSRNVILRDKLEEATRQRENLRKGFKYINRILVSFKLGAIPILGNLNLGAVYLHYCAFQT